MKTWCHRHPSAVVAMLIAALVVIIAFHVIADVTRGHGPVWYWWLARLTWYGVMIHRISVWWERT
jgi:hypothetical protein